MQFFNKPHQKHFISKDDEDDLKIELSQSVKPMIYIRHLHWIHFQEQQKPIYINMVRDPVELFISNFYYLRNGFQKTADKNSSEWKWNMSEDKRSQTIEDCIHAKGFKCKIISHVWTRDHIEIIFHFSNLTKITYSFKSSEF